MGRFQRRTRSIAPPEAGCKGVRTAALKPLTSLPDSRLAPLPAQCSTHSVRARVAAPPPGLEGKI